MRETSRNTSAADAALTYIFTHTGCRDVGWAWRVFWERSSCCVHVCLCAYVCVCVCVFEWYDRPTDFVCMSMCRVGGLMGRLPACLNECPPNCLFGSGGGSP
uniref:Uncharacterized protein n=1 Tax=Vitrella brassicaformis TaxID=1169539 RepID=A0A7S1K3H5_9ALVE|mmetsp:Transcript_35325/g.87790  ORF Transcript_35325/g.87790 Transcript_35325/m.87790 type:complete len:102 (+) Transcript_35325:305-610(+)